MKAIFLFLLLISNSIFAQYYGERTTEQSFENSDLYFKSHYLNPFGIQNFRNVAPGLINNPFLNLYINPASLPRFDDDDALIYLEFRGERTEPSIIENFVAPDFYARSYYPDYYFDPRWFTTTRKDPEPIVSVGILTYPLSEITKNFFIGGTYQLIHKEEKFYTIPYWIYYPRYYYDALGVAVNENSNIPITDRFTGKDEMLNEGHLFSAFTGYQVNDEISAGISMNAVIYSRDGEYVNSNKGEYGSSNFNDWKYGQSQGRNQDYKHLDLAAGLIYKITPQFELGIKAGLLNGKAEQNYNSLNNSFYKYNEPQVSQDWNYSISDFSNVQNWNHDGDTKYLGVNFKKDLKDGKEISGYYRYSKGSLDMTSSSIINDTSFYSSQYFNSYDSSIYNYGGYSFTHDLRNGTGNKNVNNHEGMINLKWNITEKNSVYIGFYFNSSKTKINSLEPVTAVSTSNYYNTNSNGNYNYNYFYKLVENKMLEWEYESSYWSIQIPVIFNFRFNEYWGLMLGLNKIMNNWDITDKTTAIFDFRERTENDKVTTERNFGERYIQPDKKISENFTKFFAGFDASLSKEFGVRILLDPDFEHEFRIAQWWISFESRL